MGKLDEVASSVFLNSKDIHLLFSLSPNDQMIFFFLRTDNKLLSQERFNAKGGSF